jgi:hypothetical protein
LRIEKARKLADFKTKASWWLKIGHQSFDNSLRHQFGSVFHSPITKAGGIEIRTLSEHQKLSYLRNI